MILAAASDATATFKTFDIFMILFTILIFVGVVRLLMARQKINSQSLSVSSAYLCSCILTMP